MNWPTALPRELLAWLAFMAYGLVGGVLLGAYLGSWWGWARGVESGRRLGRMDGYSDCLREHHAARRVCRVTAGLPKSTVPGEGGG
jgi:hypothetical protein